MIRHLVMWAYIDPDDPGNREKAVTVKAVLEDLKYAVEGVVKLEVHIDPLPGCNAGIMMDCLFEDEEAKEAYLKHPSRLQIRSLLRSFTKDRMCMNHRAP